MRCSARSAENRDGRKFLLTNLLLRRLIATAPARIVIVSCGVHDAAQRTGMPKSAMTDIPTLVATGGPRAGEYDGRPPTPNDGSRAPCSGCAFAWFAPVA